MKTVEALVFHVRSRCSTEEILAWAGKLLAEQREGAFVPLLPASIPDCLRDTALGPVKWVNLRSWGREGHHYVFVEYGGSEFYGIVIDPSETFLPGSRLITEHIQPGIWAYVMQR